MRMATVLIVEDEPMLHILTEAILQSIGNKTLSARSLVEAKAIVESAEEFDLLFTDLTLGDDYNGGIELANLLAQMRPDTPVVYTSGRDLTDRLKALFVKNSHFLPKPYSETEMSQCFDKMLEARSTNEKSRS